MDAMRRHRDTGLCALAMAALAVAVTWPLAALGGRGIPGYNWSDEAMFLWNFRMVERALWDGAPLLHTEALMAPWGAEFLVHTHAFLYGLFGALLRPLCVSIAAALNLVVLWSFWAAGMGAWLLARELRFGAAAAFAAGALFSFSAHRVGHIAHINLLSVEAIPIALWALARLMRAAGRHHGARGQFAYLGVLAACALYTVWIDYYTAIYLALAVAGAAAAWVALVPRRAARVLLSRRFAAAALLWGAVAVAGMVPIARSWIAFAEQLPPDLRGMAVVPRVPGVELATLLQPPPFSLAGEALWAEGTAARPVTIEQEGYLGWAALAAAACAFAGWRRLSRGRRRLALSLAAGLALALFLALENPTIGGEALSFRTPASWLAEVPLLREARVPGRIMMLAALPLGLLAAMGFEVSARVLRGNAARGIAAALWLALFFAETRRPLPVSWLEGAACHVPHALLERMARDAEPGGVLMLPFDPPAVPNLLQAYHGRPAFMGFMARGHRHVGWQLRGRDLGLLPEGMVPDTALRPDLAARRGELLRLSLETFAVRYVLVRGGDDAPAIEAYLHAHLPNAETFAERAPSGLEWTAFRIPRRPYSLPEGAPLLAPEELRIRIATDRLDVTPADLDNAINGGISAGSFSRRTATFAVHLSEAEARAYPGGELLLLGFGLPPRASDGLREEMAVAVNGTQLATPPVRLEEGVHMYRIAVPAGVLRAGWNRIGLRFLHGITPREIFPGESEDAVPRPLFVHGFELLLRKAP